MTVRQKSNLYKVKLKCYKVQFVWLLKADQNKILKKVLMSQQIKNQSQKHADKNLSWTHVLL